MDKTDRSKEAFAQYLDLLKEEIEIIPHNIIIPYIEKAEKISPDPKDSVYLACALATDSKIWSNDKKLKEGQKEIEVIITDDLISRIGIVKKKNH